MIAEVSQAVRAGADRYLQFFETLSVRTVPMMADVVTDSFRFVDPFHDVRGIAPVQQIFRNMFADLENPTFKVMDVAFSTRDPHTVYLKWRFTALRQGRNIAFTGMSDVTFDPQGKAVQHIDHWDSGKEVYAKIPLLGAVIRFIQKRVQGAT